MRGFAIFVLAFAGCAEPVYIEARNTLTLAHPSATDSVAPNVMQHWPLSITKLTDKEICIDQAITAGSSKGDAEAIAEVEKLFSRTSEKLGRCTSTGRYCDPVRYPVTQTFAPVIVKVGEETYVATDYVKTGNTEIVCTDDLQNQRGTTVGCARYVEQDETERHYKERTHIMHTAQGGLRYCFPNNGLVGPTTASFDLALGYERVRFVLTGGKARTGAWGGSGGTSSEPGAKGVATSKSTPEHAAPEHAAPEHAAPEHAAPEHAAPEHAAADPMRAKVGHPLAIAPVEISRGGKLLVSVTADGALESRGVSSGAWHREGYLAELNGAVTIAIAANGDVFLRGTPDRAARLERDRLVVANGSTISIDRDHHVRIVKGADVSISTETISSSSELALLVSWLAVGQLRFQRSR